MLNDTPKKKKAPKPDTKWRYFRRIQKVCLYRAVTPCMMYLFMSLIALALQALADGTQVYEIVLGSVCIAGGAAFNAHLAFNYGKMHFDSYLTGCLHRQNVRMGIVSGGDHRPEHEYRPWKGFLIGFYVGLPVLIFGTLAIFQPTWDWAELVLDMFAAWAILPIQWYRGAVFPGEQNWDYPPVSGGWSLLFILLPVIVTGAFYILGAYVEKRRKEDESRRTEEINAVKGKRK